MRNDLDAANPIRERAGMASYAGLIDPDHRGHVLGPVPPVATTGVDLLIARAGRVPARRA